MERKGHSGRSAGSDQDHALTSDSGQRYLFLPGLENRYSAAIRAHVLKFHPSRNKGAKVRFDRTLRSRQKSQSDRNSRITHVFLRRSDHSASYKSNEPWLPSTHLERSNVAGVQLPLAGNSSETLQASFDETDVLDSEERPLFPILKRTILGAERTDPFLTYVRRTTARENELIDFWVGDLISFFKTPSSSLHPPRYICFSVAIASQAALEVVFYYCLRHLLIRGADVAPRELWRCRSRVITSMNAALSDPRSRDSESTMMGLLGWIALFYEVRRFERIFPELESESELSKHLEGLAGLIDTSGGYSILADRPGVQWLLYLLDILSYGSLSAGRTPVSVHAYHPKSSLKWGLSTCESFIPPTDDLLSVSEESVGVYRALYTLSEVRLKQDDPNVNTCCVMFRSGTPIHRILRDSSDKLPVDPVHLLLYFNLIILEYAYAGPSKLENFLWQIRKSMVQENLDIAGCRYTLMWLLISDGSHRRLECASRVQLLCRLCRVYKHLSPSLQRQYEESLMWFLTGDEKEVTGPVITPDQFRRLAMKDVGLGRILRQPALCFPPSTAEFKGA